MSSLFIASFHDGLILCFRVSRSFLIAPAFFFVHSAKTEPFPPASSRGSRFGNETTTQENWTSPKSLVPAYEPTVLHNQRTPPKLILDDQDSDDEAHSDSMTNSVDDENIDDILNSDEEQVPRRTSKSLSLLALGNLGYEDEGDTASVRNVHKSGRSKMAGPTVANRDDHAQLNLSVLHSVSQRKTSIASSNLSLHSAGEETHFPSTKSNKKPSKQQDSGVQNKGKTLLSSKFKAKNFRKASVTPLDDDNTKLKEAASRTRRNSSLNTQGAANGERRKSSMSTGDNDVLVITPKDRYTRRERDNKVFTFEYDKTSSNHEAEENSPTINKRRKSKVNEWEHTQTSFAKDEEQARKRLTAPVAHGNGRRKSLLAERDEAQLPDMEGTQLTDNLAVSVSKANGRASTPADKGNIRIKHEKMAEGLIAPKQGHRKSLRTDEEIMISDENGTKAGATFDVEDIAGTPLVSDVEEDERTLTKSRRKMKEEVSPVRDTEDRMSKAKRKKNKTKKKNKKNADDCDYLSDMEKTVLTNSEEYPRTEEISARAEENPVTSTDLEEKDSKKKKKNKKGKKKKSRRKWQESEESNDDVEEKIEEINANTTEPEKRKRKKNQKSARTTRKLSVNSEETNRLSPGHD